MSIPTNALVYAGIWNASTTYYQYQMVVSPIDNLCYVKVDYTYTTGGPDPSVQPSTTWVNIPPPATGDITGVVAGTGLSGGGSVGNVTLTNIGVTSLNTETGDVTTKSGGFHRNTAQTISAIGAPSTVSIAWGQSSYGDTLTISQNVPNGSNFTVNQHGIYLLTLQVSYGNLASATLTDRTLRTSITITRGAGTSTIVQGNYDFADNTPPTPAVTSCAVYELQQGDQLFFQVSQYLSAGSFTLQSQSAAPNDFDYNTYWTWTLLKPLP